jgi:ribonuclease Z
MLVSLRFLTLPTADTPGAALLLHFPDRRYIFGRAAEGLQRAVVQRGVGVRRASELFVSGAVAWDAVGGLLGFMLTQADMHLGRAKALRQTNDERASLGRVQRSAGEPDCIHVHGPPNLLHAIAAARTFILRTGTEIAMDEIKDGAVEDDIRPSWTDHNIRVWAMNIKPRAEPLSPRKRSFEETTSPPVDDTANGNDEHEQQIRHAIVQDMFSSTWRKDALVEMALKDVDMGKLYVRDPITKDLKEYTGPFPNDPGANIDPNMKVLVRKPWPAATLKEIPPTTMKKHALSYIVGTYPSRGKFMPQKARELGIRPGPMYAKLANGQSVENSEGKTITPDMVLGESRLGHGFAVIDLPGDEYVEPLIQRPEWKSADVMQGVAAIVWILGSGVTQNAELRAFMERMKHLKQFVASPDHCPNNYAMGDAAAMTSRLATISPHFFRMPVHSPTQLPQDTLRVKPDATADLPPHCQAAELGMLMMLKPDYSFQVEELPPAKSNSVSPEIAELARAADSKNEEIKEELDAWRSTLAYPDAEIITLGTGSAMPSKYRNVLSTVVRIPGRGTYILDCGENTLGQLQRVFTKSELVEILHDLRMIWISHMHADHHLGTVSLIKAWYDQVHGSKPLSSPLNKAELSQLDAASREYISVISRQKMLLFLSDYASVEDFGFSRVLPLSVTNAQVDTATEENWSRSQLVDAFTDAEIPQKLYPSIVGFSDIQAVAVKHCVGAQAVALTFPGPEEQPGSRFRVAFSGDCRPSAHLAVVGRGADVLIHEATFDDELVGEAHAKLHSTTGEALCVAEAMGAKALVLTHFSQRYQKITASTAALGGGSGRRAERRAAAMEWLRAEGGVRRQRPSAERDPTCPEAALEEQEGAAGGVEETGPVVARPSPSLARSFAGDEVPADLKVCTAFDYMRIKVGDIPKVEAYTPAYAEMLKDRDRDDDGEGAEDDDAEIKPPVSKKAKKNRTWISRSVLLD